jgi:DNA-binding PucR family transcriptional regulator
VERASVRLSTQAQQRMERTLPWFDGMSPEVRASVGLLVQAGIRAFAEWLRTPDEASRITGVVFAEAPRELARLVTLQQTVELVRVAVEVTEESIGDLATPDEQSWLREATLRFSREIAFAAALVYARAAEQRGAWDARLESLVVDAILRGEVNDALLSRAAALGWSQPQAVVVITGYADETADPEHLVEEVHARGAAVGADVLAGVQSQRLVVLAGSSGRITRVVRAVLPAFGDGPVVTGPVVDSLADAGRSCRAAFAGLRAAPGWPDAPRPVASDALLPERVLLGDADARNELVDGVYRRLEQRSDDLLATASTFLSCGGSIESTARTMFVHPNTVRYRLGRVAEVCGRNLNDPRERYVVQLALALGRLDQPASL